MSHGSNFQRNRPQKLPLVTAPYGYKLSPLFANYTQSPESKKFTLRISRNKSKNLSLNFDPLRSHFIDSCAMVLYSNIMKIKF